MAGPAIKPRKPMNTPEWIFRWRGSNSSFFPMLLAVTFALIAFALLVTTVRIRVVMPGKSTPRSAAVIHLRDDVEGRALGQLAQEGGPFPSRFEPSQWEGLAGFEKAAMNATRYQPQAYAPKLRDLPEENQLRPLDLATKGESFFPKPPVQVGEIPNSAALKLVPVLYPLSGDSSAMPTGELPPFPAPIDGAMTSAFWRFLVRLGPDGNVAEGVSLEKGGEAGALELASWLHQVSFKPAPGKSARWLAVGIDFTNQPSHGPNAH